MLRWNGKDLPEELRELPAGTYILEPVDEPIRLTPDEDRGLQAALASLREKNGRTLEQVQHTIDAILRK
ncbi:MAG TPA: hypothetical protein VFK02_35695 [Kofleriaceae bacterium]|nr:hypothetical protein [Kofleriaceae bacterium]